MSVPHSYLPLNSVQTQQEAAEWLARLMSPGSTELDRAAFERWRRRSPENSAAVAEIERLWGRVDELLERDMHFRQLAEEARYEDELFDDFDELEDWQDPYAPQTWSEKLADALPEQPTTARHWTPPSRSWLFMGALAVGSAAAAYGGWYWYEKETAIPEPVEYSTASDELRPLSLQDGSIVDLDIATVFSMQFKEGRLRVAKLTSGRALFDVAYDDRAPFRVDMGDTIALATGGRFQLQRGEDRVVVTVLEGTLQLGPRPNPGAELQGALLQAGEQIAYTTDKPDTWFRRDVDPRAMGAWSRGRLVFDNTPLVDVVDEVNRYALAAGSRQLRLSHPVLNSLKVSGSFPMGDGIAAAKALIQQLPVRAAPGKEEGSEIVLSYRGIPKAKKPAQQQSKPATTDSQPAAQQ